MLSQCLSSVVYALRTVHALSVAVHKLRLIQMHLNTEYIKSVALNHQPANLVPGLNNSSQMASRFVGGRGLKRQRKIKSSKL